jgi:hypothetical protein
MEHDLNSTSHCQPFPQGRPAYYQTVRSELPVPRPQEDQQAKLAELEVQAQRIGAARKRWLITGDDWTQAILEECERSPEAVRITTLANLIAKADNNKTWKDFEARKVSVFRHIALMIRQGRLDRVARRFVTIPRSDEKWKAYLEALDKPVSGLPEPSL